MIARQSTTQILRNARTPEPPVQLGDGSIRTGKVFNMSGGGISPYRILSGYKSLGKPVRRDDGRWLVRDICGASCLIALGHTLAGIEEYTDPDRKVRVTWVFEASETFEADYRRFERGDAVPIRRFLDSFFSLYHIAKSKPARRLL